MQTNETSKIQQIVPLPLSQAPVVALDLLEVWRASWALDVPMHGKGGHHQFGQCSAVAQWWYKSRKYATTAGFGKTRLHFEGWHKWHHKSEQEWQFEVELPRFPQIG